MNWDEKAYLEDGRRREIGSGFPCLTDELFIDGAKWQRDQLRTNEAIERVARGICRRNWPKNDDFAHYWQWYCDDFRADARAAITALLGDE